MRRLTLTSLALALASAAALHAQTCSLVWDINPAPGRSSFPASLACRAGRMLLMQANDGMTGDELWKIDVTGAALVKDINPGAGNSGPGEFGSCWTGSQLVTLFAASDGTNGRELWATDGSAVGTVLVRDIYPGSWGSSPDALTCCDNRVFFIADDGTSGTELWVSDGTAAGTVLLKDINPGLPSSWPSELVSCGGVVYFTANDGVHGSELWCSDGTSAGTVMVKEIYPGSNGGSPYDMVCFEDKLVFGAHGSNGTELWVSDGSPAGTVEVKDIHPGVVSSGPRHLTRAGDVVYFRANDGTNGAELWVSDLTAAGTVMVKDIHPGPGGSTPTNFVWCQGRLFFAASVPTSAGGNGTELWVSDGTSAGTLEVKDISPGGSSSSPSNLICVGRGVYFRAIEPSTGYELYFSDGTGPGTTLVCDINPGSAYSSPNGMMVCGGSLYFTAHDSTVGTEVRTLLPVGGTVERLGRGCGPTYPTLDATNPLVGATVVLSGRSAPPGHLGVLLIGSPAAPFSRTGVHGLGCSAWINVGFMQVLGIVFTSSWNANLPIPANGALVGLKAMCQTWYVSTPYPIATDNAVQFTVGT